MGDSGWVVSAGLCVMFLIGALASRGALAIGWLVLAIGMVGVTVVRYRSARSPRG